MAERHPRTIEIRDGKARALVYPEHGFQLHGFEVDMPGHGAVPGIYGPPGRGEPWDRRYGNPILFPNIVHCHGASRNSYQHAGQSLLMPQHGWARDLYWHVESIEPSAVSGWLEPTHGVALAYPFQFTLRLRYSLQDGVLSLDGEVANTGADPLPYAFGFHPYLRAPISSAGSRKGCSVTIAQGTRLRTTDEWTTVARSPQPSLHLEVSDPSLSEGFVLEGTTATALEVVDSKAQLKTRVSVQDSQQPMPVWAVWSAAPDAEYVCLEPWTDEPNSLNRPGRPTLPAGASHRYRMSIALAAL